MPFAYSSHYTGACLDCQRLLVSVVKQAADERKHLAYHQAQPKYEMNSLVKRERSKRANEGLTPKVRGATVRRSTDATWKENQTKLCTALQWNTCE